MALKKKDLYFRCFLRAFSIQNLDINTIVKSKELVQFAYAFAVPAQTGAQVATRQHLHTRKARTASAIVFVFVEDANDSNLIKTYPTASIY